MHGKRALLIVLIFLLSVYSAMGACYTAKISDVYGLSPNMANLLGVADEKICYTSSEALDNFELENGNENKICQGTVDPETYNADYKEQGIDLLSEISLENHNPNIDDLISSWESALEERDDFLTKLDDIRDNSQNSQEKRDAADMLYDAIFAFDPENCATIGKRDLRYAYFRKSTFTQIPPDLSPINGYNNYYTGFENQCYVTTMTGSASSLSVPTGFSYGQCYGPIIPGASDFSYEKLQDFFDDLNEMIEDGDSNEQISSFIEDNEDLLTTQYDIFHSCLMNEEPYKNDDALNLADPEQVGEWIDKTYSLLGSNNPDVDEFNQIFFDDSWNFLYHSKLFSVDIKNGAGLVIPSENSESVRFAVSTQFECVDFSTQDEQVCCYAKGTGSTSNNPPEVKSRALGYSINTDDQTIISKLKYIITRYNYLYVWNRDITIDTQSVTYECRADSYMSLDGQRCTPSLIPGDSLYDYLETPADEAYAKLIALTFGVPIDEINSNFDGGGVCTPGTNRECRTAMAYIALTSQGKPIYTSDEKEGSVCRYGTQICDSSSQWQACTGVGLPNVVDYSDDLSDIKLGEYYDIYPEDPDKNVYFSSPSFDLNSFTSDGEFSNGFLGEGFDDDCNGIIDDGIEDISKNVCQDNDNIWAGSYPFNLAQDITDEKSCCGDDSGESFVATEACLNGVVSDATRRAAPFSHNFISDDKIIVNKDDFETIKIKNLVSSSLFHFSVDALSTNSLGLIIVNQYDGSDNFIAGNTISLSDGASQDSLTKLETNFIVSGSAKYINITFSAVGEKVEFSNFNLHDEYYKYLLQSKGLMFFIIPFPGNLYSCGNQQTPYRYLIDGKSEPVIKLENNMDFCEMKQGYICQPNGWSQKGNLPSDATLQLKDAPMGANLILNNNFGDSLPGTLTYPSMPNWILDYTGTFADILVITEQNNNIVKLSSSNIKTLPFFIKSGDYDLKFRYKCESGGLSFELDSKSSFGSQNPEFSGQASSSTTWIDFSQEYNVGEDEVYQLDISSSGICYIDDISMTAAGSIDKIELDSADVFGCCPSNNCWNPNTKSCVSGDISSEEGIIPDNDPRIMPIKDNADQVYSCSMNQGSAQWVLTDKKFDWVKTSSKMCPADTCYKSQGGDACVPSGYIEEDHLCAEGKWTTRTATIAQKLLDYAGTGSFTLFCDDLNNNDNILSEYDYLGVSSVHYSLNSIEDISDSLTKGEFNNFCVLQKGDEVIIGASSNLGANVENLKIFNSDSDSRYDSFLKIFEQLSNVDAQFNSFTLTDPVDDHYTFCDNAIDRDAAADKLYGEYTSCSGNDKLWYNKELNTFIFSKEEFNINPGALTLIFTAALNKLDFFSEFDYIADVEKTSDYNRLYVLNKDTLTQGKAIIGVTEKINNNDVLVVRYKDFGNVCPIINDYLNSKLSTDQLYQSTDEYCKQDSDVSVLELPNYDIILEQNIDIWPDLSAKIRSQ